MYDYDIVSLRKQYCETGKIENVKCDGLLPSGVVWHEPLTPLTAPVCTPYQPVLESNIEFINTKQVDDYKSIDQSTLKLSSSDLTSYGNALANASKSIKLFQPDTIIVPLCGGLRPASILYPMNNFETAMFPVPFTQGSSGKYDKIIIDEIGRNLESFLKNNVLRIGIIDTGDGGQGLRAMTKLLHQLHNEAAPQCTWFIKFFIFVEPKSANYLDQTNDVKEMVTKERFLIEREVFFVNNLIGEDVREACNYRIDWSQNGENVFEPTSFKGSLLINHPEHQEIARHDNFSDLIDLSIAKHTTNNLLTSTENLYVGDIWDLNDKLPNRFDI